MFNQKILLADMERRAFNVGLKLYQVCEIAGLAPSTYYRWKKGSPANISNLNKVDEELRVLETRAA